MDLTFGLTDGWWRFSDHDLRGEHALLGADQWLAVLEACGFEEARRIPAAGGGRALAGQAVLVARVPTAEPATPAARQWLVLADRGGVASRVAEILERRPAQKVMVVPAGSRLAPRPDDGAHWHAVVDLRALDTPVVAGPDVVGEASTLCAQAVDLIRTLAEAGATPRVWLVTKGAQPIADRSEPIAVAQAPIWGLGRVIALEHPELWGGLVDLDPAETVAAPPSTSWSRSRRGRGRSSRIPGRATLRAAADAGRHRPENRVAVHPDGGVSRERRAARVGLQVARSLVDQGRGTWSCSGDTAWTALGSRPRTRRDARPRWPICGRGGRRSTWWSRTWRIEPR